MEADYFKLQVYSVISYASRRPSERESAVDQQECVAHCTKLFEYCSPGINGAAGEDLCNVIIQRLSRTMTKPRMVNDQPLHNQSQPNFPETPCHSACAPPMRRHTGLQPILSSYDP
jgi:hypothetical protein